MQIRPLTPRQAKYLTAHNLTSKFSKQLLLLLSNFRHPSLHTELLEPKQVRIYSFRIDRKYRALFSFKDADTIVILDINDHYQ